jgi:hypothetical protein
MKYDFKVIDKGLVQPITIEPSIYQGRHLYEVGINDTYMMVYQEDDQWKCDDEHQMNPDLLAQVTEKIMLLTRKLQA